MFYARKVSVALNSLSTLCYHKHRKIMAQKSGKTLHIEEPLERSFNESDWPLVCPLQSQCLSFQQVV